MSDRFSLTVKRTAITTSCILSLLWAPSVLTPASANSTNYHTQQDEIVVTGERNGPRLWRVVKGDAELFVLVSVGLIPSDMEWEESQVAQVLEEADQLLYSPDTNVNTTRLIGTFIRTILFNRGRIMMKKGTTISDKVGTELGGEFETTRKLVAERLKTRELLEKAKPKKKEEDEDDLEEDEDRQLSPEDQKKLEKRLEEFKPTRFHPYLQSQNLISEAIRAEGLVSFNRIERRVKKMARKAKVKSKPILTIKFAHADIKKVLKGMRKFSQDTNSACIRDAIDYVNDDLADRANRAEAWAQGDARYLQQSIPEVRINECTKAVSKELGGLKSFGGEELAEIDLLDDWVEVSGQT